MKSQTKYDRFNPFYGDKIDGALTRAIQWSELLGLTPRETFGKCAEIFADEFFGVESVELEGTSDDSSAASAEYLNSGDTYNATLILTDDYVSGVAVIVSSWGDWYESAENEYNERCGTIRCGHCGILTDCDEDDYTNTVCDCGKRWNEC